MMDFLIGLLFDVNLFRCFCITRKKAIVEITLIIGIIISRFMVKTREFDT